MTTQLDLHLVQQFEVPVPEPHATRLTELLPTAGCSATGRAIEEYSFGPTQDYLRQNGLFTVDGLAWLLDNRYLREVETGRSWPYVPALLAHAPGFVHTRLEPITGLTRQRLLFQLKGYDSELTFVSKLLLFDATSSAPWRLLRGELAIGGTEIGGVRHVSDDLIYLTGAVDAGAAFHIDEFIFSPTGYEVDLANGSYRFADGDMPAGIALFPVVSVQCGSVTEGHTVTLVPSLQVDASGGVMRLRDTRRDEYAELPLGRAGVQPAHEELLRAARHGDHILIMDATRASVLLLSHYVVRG